MQPVSCSRCTDCTWRTLFVRRKARRSIDVTAARSLPRSYRADEYLQFNMRFKRIGAIGGSLITTVCLLSGLMYYFNQDSLERTIDPIFSDFEIFTDACPGGTFLCQNTTMCLPQRNWCNQEVQCPYGDDEANCYVDPHGVLEWFGINREALMAALRNSVCNDTDTPVGCVYKGCRATCQGYTEIPQNLSSKTISIGLYDSSIERVPADAFASYSEIRLL